MALGDNNVPNLGPFESESAMMDPQSNEEVAAGSMSNILRMNQGYYVSCEFLIGTSNLVTKEGILYESGINFLALYEPSEERYTVCDLYSLKFITFYPARTPQLPQANQPPIQPVAPIQPAPMPRMAQQPPQQQQSQQWQGTQQWQMPRPSQTRPPMV